MQIFKDFDTKEHDCFSTLFVEQPKAKLLIQKGIIANRGVRSVLIVDKQYKYRGELLICSKFKPTIEELDCGCTIGFVNLKKCVKAGDLNDKEWIGAGVIDKAKRRSLSEKWALVFNNPREVIPFPAYELSDNIHEIWYTKGEIMEYPTEVVLDKKALKKIRKNARK